MPTLETRLDRLEKRSRTEADIDLAAVFDRAAESPGISHDDRRRLHELASDWRTTGGKKYARLLHELSDDGLSTLAEMREMSWRIDPWKHAGLFLFLATDPELSDGDRETCRELGEQLRAGRIGLEVAVAELSDAALERAGGHHEHFSERCNDGK